MQLCGFILDIIDSLELLHKPTRTVESFAKEFFYTAKIFKNSKNSKNSKSIIADEGLDIIGRKKRTFKTYGFRNSANKQLDKRYYKVVRPLENRGILLTESTIKINSQEGRLLNFLAP